MEKCPHCGNETPDNEKCTYCKFVLKKKTNNFNQEIYAFLRSDYLQTRNKAVSIKNGMQRFGLSMKEAKEILDFIADEVYEQENYRSSDEVNDTGKYDRKIFRFSFIQYFMRNLIYKVIFLILWGYAIRYSLNLPLDHDVKLYLSVGMMTAGFIMFIVFCYQWGIASTGKVIADSGIINYIYRMPSGDTGKKLDRMDSSEAWGMSHNHCIEIVKEVTDGINCVYVYGTVKRQTEKYHHLGTKKYQPASMVKVKIPKYFKDYRKLRQVLEDYKR